MGDKFRLIETPQPASEAGYGRGYTIGCIISFGLIAASFLAVFLARRSEVGRIRALGYLLISFGAAFTWVNVYTVVTHKGIHWATSYFGRIRTGVFDRKTTPVGFWTSSAILLLISSSLIGGGIWLVRHPVEFVTFGRLYNSR